jgi:diguanylate cyclase (GGDEF)-like protein
LPAAPNPKLQTAIITAFAVTLSWAITRLFLEMADVPHIWLADFLSAGLPAVLAPLSVYPLLRANARLRDLQAELETAAHTDVLTGLPNRRAFFERACFILARHTAKERTMAAMMVDIDNFKPINDTHGHDAGDDILTAVAAVVRRTVAGSGAADWVVARMGGEEFAVVVDDLEPAAIVRLAEQICVNARRIDCARQPGSRLGVTLSVGVAFRTAAMEIDDLLKAADGAVYDAKRCGRDRWAFALGDFGEGSAPFCHPRVWQQGRASQARDRLLRRSAA